MEKKEVCAEKWYYQEDQRIQKGIHEDRHQQSFADGPGTRKSVGTESLMHGIGPKRSIKKAIGQCSRKRSFQSRSRIFLG